MPPCTSSRFLLASSLLSDRGRSSKGAAKSHADGWTEVAKKSGHGLSSHSSLSMSSTELGNSKAPGHPSIPIGAQSKFADLLSETSDSFFREDDSESPTETPIEGEGSRLAKLIGQRKLTGDITSPHAVTNNSESALSSRAPTFTPQSQKIEGDTSFMDALRTHMITSPPPVDLPSLNWIYLDPNGKHQGPFTTSQMATWHAAGYFPEDLPVAWVPGGTSLAATAVFHPLNRVYLSGPAFVTAPTAPMSPRVAAPQVSSPKSPKGVAPQSAAPKSPPPAAPQSTQVVTSPEEANASRGWLWSPEEDLRLAQARPDVTPSLAEIMAIEAAKKKGPKKDSPPPRK